MPTRDELFLAYRQAKAALFFDRRGVGLIELARFEQDLCNRLDLLASQLSVNGGWFDGLPTGEVWVVPKKLRVDDDDTIVYIGGKPTNSRVEGLDIQVRYTPSPESAIVEVLFLWRFGPILESLLSKNSLGYRLDLKGGRLLETRRWLFEYWPKRYDEYRTTPINVARRELAEGHSVVLLTADLTSFYDTVDPSFLLSDDFIGELERTSIESGRASDSDISEYRSAAASLLRFYSEFQQRASRRTGLPWPIGIPIGALTSRLVANLALATFDSSIEARSSTQCYKRYVDDFAIVTRVDHAENRDLEQDILANIPNVRIVDGKFCIDEKVLKRRGSEFRIQKAKCKAYHLRGVSGRDFLASVQRDFGQLVSERRAFLDPTIFLEDQIESVLHAGPPGRRLTVLRQADRTKLKHLELGTRLRALERVSILVDNESASQMARRALEETTRFLRGEEDWVGNMEVALRMFRIGIRTRDWDHTDNLFDYMENLWHNVEDLRNAAGQLFHRERKIENSNCWIWLRNYLHRIRIEAICSVLSAQRMSSTPKWLRQGVVDRTRIYRWRALVSRARLLAATDLRAFDREDDAFAESDQDLDLDSSDFGQNDSSLRVRLNRIRKFVAICQKRGVAAWTMSPDRLFLCTRPPSYFDVARRVLSLAGVNLDSKMFADLLEMVNAIRGTRYGDPVGHVIDKHTVKITGRMESEQRALGNPQLILGNLVLSEDYFTRAATRKSGSNTGDPVLTAKRLSELSDILADATESARRHYTGDTLLVLPELSLPRAWFREVATYVSKHGGFGLIVGLEYFHAPKHRWVYNQVYVVIPGPFNSTATWPWTKEYPAREEASKLLEQNVTFRPKKDGASERRTVVISPYGRVSVVICSELIEANRISDLARRVEVVAVPAWNRDTSSYDHLIQSAGLQLNAIVGIANNGYYSDCRAWAPKKKRWQRDLCRLIERDTNRVISVEIPLNSLRDWRKSGLTDGKQDESEWRPLPPDWHPLDEE